MKWDTLILWLHKLGILRTGSYAKKFTGDDIPIQTVMDDVIDPEKDIMFDFDKKKKNKDKKDV